MQNGSNDQGNDLCQAVLITAVTIYVKQSPKNTVLYLM